MSEAIKLCKRCGGCFLLTEAVVCACPHCGHDEGEIAEYRVKIGLILVVEACIVAPLTWFMSIMAGIFAIVLVSEDKFLRMIVEVTLFVFFVGSEEVGDKIGCYMVLTYVNALATGWFFLYQFSRLEQLGLVQLRLLPIIGAFHIICAVATGILIFYISKYL